MGNIVNEKDMLPMKMVYVDVMARLREERMAHGLSQEDLGSRIRITQGHYSKVEQAIKRFTYYEMKILAETELDFYYICTGRRASGKYRELMEKSSYGELLCFLHMLLSIDCCLHEERRLELERETYRQLCRIKYVTGAEEGRETVFRLVRRYEKHTQFEMADCLGMDVKKYRELERGMGLPDSELIWKLYALYQVPPAYVLKDAKSLACEIEYYLERFEPRRNTVLYKYFSLQYEAYVRKRRQQDREGGAEEPDA